MEDKEEDGNNGSCSVEKVTIVMTVGSIGLRTGILVGASVICN